TNNLQDPIQKKTTKTRAVLFPCVLGFISAFSLILAAHSSPELMSDPLPLLSGSNSERWER
ncbi:MAG: hypothetical protein ACJ74Y_16470, partial [Bryobacteraceae bacterium]